MKESTLYLEHFLEYLYTVYGDVGSTGRSIRFLTRSLSLPDENVKQIASILVDQGYVKPVFSAGDHGYIMTSKGAQYFARKFLKVSSSLVEQPLSATLITSLVDYIFGRIRGRELKTYLHKAFRTDAHPVFQRATRARLQNLLEDHNAPYRCAYIYRLVKELLHPGRFTDERVSRLEQSSLLRILKKEGILDDLEGTEELNTEPHRSEIYLDEAKLDRLKSELMALDQLDPKKRGFAFERFLKQLFDLYKLDPRSSFRLKGEQIDGSFQLGDHVYLLEAKWEKKLTAVSDLLVFREKVESKSTWSRGLFVSYSGFTKDGIEAFGRGRATNIIGMTGQELYLIMEGRVALEEAIKKKARIAAETGQFYTSLQELLPK